MFLTRLMIDFRTSSSTISSSSIWFTCLYKKHFAFLNYCIIRSTSSSNILLKALTSIDHKVVNISIKTNKNKQSQTTKENKMTKVVLKNNSNVIGL